MEVAAGEAMSVTIKDNYYDNVSILKDRRIFYFKSDSSDVSITNETVINCHLNDLYSIAEANNIVIDDFRIHNTVNTNAITETSSILRILKANSKVTVTNFEVMNSVFNYGKAFEIESAHELDFSISSFEGNKL